MELIKLTRSATGGEIYVNPNWIVDIFSDEDSTLIALPMKDTYIPVLESPESIANLIMSGDEQPGTDIPVRKVGEWIDDGGPATLICGRCNYRVMRYNNTKFCPNCSARMNGETENGRGDA